LSYYIGLLSGTSVDGIDAAIVSINEKDIELIETLEKPFSADLKKQLQALIQTQQTTLANYANCDHQIAIEFSVAVNELIEKSTLDARDIVAIGSHGQTIYHQPNEVGDNKRNTLQIGSAHIIAATTGIPVVSNFRNIDMAFHGQGAPLAPIIHQKLFNHDNQNIAVLNLGGIANITYLGRDYAQIIGYDTGPANCLMDEWITIHQQKPFDKDGSWAKQGKVNEELLKQMLSDDYFQQSAPKSTGREYFNFKWYDNFVEQFRKTSADDIQTTLGHLTAKSIAQALPQNIDKIILMGGGAHNDFLVHLIKHYTAVKTAIAQNPNWIEAMLFAYLAHLRLNNIPINLGSITGSFQPILVGDIVEV
jgi:anhydro-N-acetylmuramic acid kinase